MKLRLSILAVSVSLFGLSACSNGKFSFGDALGDISRVTGVKPNPTLHQRLSLQRLRAHHSLLASKRSVLLFRLLGKVG